MLLVPGAGQAERRARTRPGGPKLPAPPPVSHRQRSGAQQRRDEGPWRAMFNQSQTLQSGMHGRLNVGDSFQGRPDSPVALPSAAMSNASRPPAPPVGILDNRSRGAAGDFLKAHLKDGTELSVVSAYFTISAYESLKQELENVEQMRFLYGAPQHLRALTRDKRPERAFGLTEAGLAPTRQLTQRAEARRCADWIRRKAEIRSVKDELLHGKLYHIMGNRADAMNRQFEFHPPRPRSPGAQERRVESRGRWGTGTAPTFSRGSRNGGGDEQRTEDVKDRVLRELELLHRNHSPRFIYHLTLYHLFAAELADIAGTEEDLDRRGLGRTALWKSLFEFQRDAAKIVIDRVKRLNGCILADSVGLGKTYTALAVIKYFELQNERVSGALPQEADAELEELQGELDGQSVRGRPPPLRRPVPYRSLPRHGLERGPRPRHGQLGGTTTWWSSTSPTTSGTTPAAPGSTASPRANRAMKS